VHIRRYEDRDHDAVKTLHRLALEEAGAFVAGPWDNDMDSIREVYLNDGGEFLVGEEATVVVAMGALRRLDDNRVEIKRIRVHPDYQRQGRGQHILDELESRATLMGYQCAELDTLENQSGAISFFLKNGYLQNGHRLFEGRMQLLFRKAFGGGA
jgi:ribosomal protein S18 acetylase RimI-like enzyme